MYRKIRHNRIPFLLLVILCLFTGSLVALFLHVLFSRLINEGSLNWHVVLTIISVLLGLFISLSLSLSVLLFSQRGWEKAYLKELRSLNKKAVTDTLTNLYNRYFLDTYLETKVSTASLLKQPLSIILIDLDHFKRINDTFGHAAGDYLLTFFAEVALKCIRKTDLIARYGGEEFIVVLPETDTDTAEFVAERIRQMVAHAQIPLFDGISLPNFTCSLGISTYPDFCNCKNSLIRTADNALYEAKRSGRNCTKVYKKDAILKNEEMTSAQPR